VDDLDWEEQYEAPASGVDRLTCGRDLDANTESGPQMGGLLARSLAGTDRGVQLQRTERAGLGGEEVYLGNLRWGPPEGVAGAADDN
jgi:hypothetical protein